MDLHDRNNLFKPTPMKSIITVLLAFTFIASFGQEKRLNAYGSYVFDDSFDNYATSNSYFNGKIKGGLQWGLGAEFKLPSGVGAELIYYRQDTQAPVNYYNLGAVNRTLDVGVNYALLGLQKYIEKDKFEPFGGILLGAAIFSNKHPAPGEPSSNTKFALGLRLGATIWASDHVGIRLQAQFLSSVQQLGGGLYFGTGGAGAGVSTYSTITQFGLGGALVFKIGS